MRKITHERALFLERMYAEMMLNFTNYRVIYSQPGIRWIKLIVKHLLYELYLLEDEKIDRLQNEGKLTPKNAISLRAKNRKNYSEIVLKLRIKEKITR